MARVVILSFQDNDAAEAFVEHTLEAQAAKHGGIPIAISAHVVAHAQVEAMVARPTVSCRCRIVGMTQFFREKGQRRRTTGKFEDPTDRLEYSLAMGRWIKSERFGWLIHDKCKRPNFFPVKNFISNMVLGCGANDLLPELKRKLWEEDNPILGPEKITVEQLAEGFDPERVHTQVPSNTL
jgi:hypothetical protein